MSRPANPARIGLFVLVGTLLAAATVLYVGSVRILAQDETFVLYFGESVNGLSVGSPVKFKGVRIGSVSDIRLSFNQNPEVEGAFIPVLVKIDEGRVRSDFQHPSQFSLFDDAEFEAQVQRGLRGRLQLESFITGQLFVELDYYEDPGQPFRRVQHEPRFKEIPTQPSVMTELGSSTADVLATVATIDFLEISQQLTLLLRNLNNTVHALEPERWSVSLTSIGTHLDRILTDVEVKPTMDRLNEVLDDFQALTRHLDTSIDPVLTDYHQLAAQLSDTLERSNQVIANLDALTAPEAELQYELRATLAEFHRAARSARELLDYLERNPRALLTGRGE